jgi:hypothetical protein
MRSFTEHGPDHDDGSYSRLDTPTRARKRTEPTRTETVRFGLSRTEPNSNRLFETEVEPNRTRTDCSEHVSNRTELEPEKFGSFRVCATYEF